MYLYYVGTCAMCNCACVYGCSTTINSIFSLAQIHVCKYDLRKIYMGHLYIELIGIYIGLMGIGILPAIELFSVYLHMD